MTSIALIDLSGLFFRHWHARGDSAINDARLGVIADVHATARKHDHCAVCVDSPKSWRKERYQLYKANRDPHDAQCLEQLRRTLETLSEDGFCMLEAEGFEADDVMATAAAALCEAGDVYLYSADKDLLQCLRAESDSAGAVVRVSFAKSPPQTTTVAALRDELGLTPDQIPAWLALMGDTSDNVPGVTRCGTKTAVKWLQKWSTVGGVVRAACDRAEGLTELDQRNILQAEDNPDCPLRLALELVTLRRDVPIDVACVTAARTAKRTETDDDFPGGEDDMTQQEDTAPPAVEPASYVMRGDEAVDEKTGEVLWRKKQAPEAQPIAKTEVLEAELIDMSAPQAEIDGNGTTQAIVRAPQQWELAFEPNDMRQAWWLAKTVMNARMFSAYGNKESVLLVLMAGRELGLGAMASLRNFHVVEGRPTMSAQLMMAICRNRRDLCKTFRVVKMTREEAIVETQRTDETEPSQWSFTIKDAEEARLAGKDNWKKYPRNMLVNRAIAIGARFAFPEVCANLYDPEELEG